MRRSRIAVLALVSVLAAAVAAPALAGSDSRPDRQSVELDDARMKFEINATDGDGGIHVFIDGEQWSWVAIFDPGGRRMLTSRTSGAMALQGGTELFLESAEPTFDELPLEELLQRFPEGKYRFRGEDLDGNRLVGTAILTHNLPDGPNLVSPLEGDPAQDPESTTLEWEPVAPANGSPIIGYQVLVVQEDTDLPALPTIALDIIMPPTATSLTVPSGFLQPDTEYEWEVLAIEESGNQTLSSSFFVTTQ